MIGAIVQARMGSSRLPGKVMKHILGRPLLFYLIERLRRSKLIQKIIIATSTEPEDVAILEYAKVLGVKTFAGSKEDVLDRYYHAARKNKIDTIVRITGDCPLLDPELTDEVVKYFLEHQDYDLVRTGMTYPEGFSTEVIPFRSLAVTWRDAGLKSEREHVTPFIWKNNKRFRVKDLELQEDFPYIRLTVDESVDLVVIRNVIENLYPQKQAFCFSDIIDLYKAMPEIFMANQHVVRKGGYYKSLEEDLIQDKIGL